MKRPLPAVVVFILGVALAAGCGDHSGRREGGSAIAPPSPSHPAMAPSGGDPQPGGKSAGSGPTEVGGGALPEGHPAVGGAEPGGLPPGHPPLGGKSDGGAQSGTSAEGPEVRIGPLTLTAPEGWVRRAPSSGFVTAEFGLPRVEGDAEDGRLTISTAGGSVDANISRWQSQFKETPQAKPENLEISGLKAVTVRLAGTLSGGGGPMAKGGPDKPNSKMWGAVIPLPATNVFIKATGPQRTMERWDESFGKFLNSLKSQAGAGPSGR